LQDASNAIINAYSDSEGRAETVNSWLTTMVDKHAGLKKTTDLYDELINIGQKEAGTGAPSEASQMRAARNNPNAFLENQGWGESTSPTASYEDIRVVVDPKDNPKDAIYHKMKSVVQIDNASEYQAMLRVKYASIAGLSQENREMIKLPDFQWPTYTYKDITKISVGYDETSIKFGRKHPGLDIVSKKKNISTEGMPIYAAADGHIISVTKLDNSSVRQENWADWTSRNLSKEVWSLENQKILRSKKVEYSGGRARRSGLSIKIQHIGGWVSSYSHIREDDKYLETLENWESSKGKLYVKKGDHISNVGNTGRSTGPHLHFSLTRHGTPEDPKKTILEKKLSKRSFPPNWFSPDTQPLSKAHDQIQESLNNQRGLIRAYPTYKLYFVESDEGERHFFGFDDFFSYQAVQDIQLVRSANNPADLLIVKLTNLSGYLTNRRFKDIRLNQNKKGEVPIQASPIAGNDEDGKAIRATEEIRNAMHADTIKENPITSLFLKEGTQIQLRLGFNPNPKELENVFDGLIMDIQFHNSDDIITIVCQSFGMELAAGVIGLNKQKEFKDEESKTGVIMEQLLASPELKHFGRWEPSTSITGGGSSQWKPWELINKIRDPNVFPPTVGLEDESKFVAYKTTIWDIAQELTHRHPGYIAYPVSYDGEWGPRMTLFFGLPSGNYVARDSNWDEQETVRLIELITRQEQEGSANLRDKKKALALLTDPSINSHDKKVREVCEKIGKDAYVDETFYSMPFFGKSYWHTRGVEYSIADKIKAFSKKRGIIKPFRKYHLISSEHNLIANNIISSAYSTFNAATIEYSSSEQEVEDQKLQFGSPETLSVIVDSLIPEEEIREIYAGFENCYGREQAKRFSQALLWKSMKKGYRGSFTISGNPEIKPHDICYVYDTYTDMHGPIEVEQVIHRFSHQTGFVTEIIPMMCVHTNETATMPTIDVLGMMVEKWLGMDLTKAGKNLPRYEEALTPPGLLMAGGLMAVKIPALGLAMKGVLAFVTGLGPVGWIALGGAALFMAGYMGAGALGWIDDDPDEEGSTGLLDDLGLFMFRKYITRTQMAHLFEYSPLIVRGRPMLGGLPTRTKAPGSFMQGWWDDKVKWWNEGKEARPILDFELQMLNNPENFPDYHNQNLRGALGEEEE
jgi:murein DD-endopeptidase MepM/ murein hydrolase activator NlpD